MLSHLRKHKNVSLFLCGYYAVRNVSHFLGANNLRLLMRLNEDTAITSSDSFLPIPFAKGPLA